MQGDMHNFLGKIGAPTMMDSDRQRTILTLRASRLTPLRRQLLAQLVERCPRHQVETAIFETVAAPLLEKLVPRP